MIEFNEILEEVLKVKNLKITDLNKLTKLSRMQIYRINKNKNEPTLYVLNELSLALNIDFDDYNKIGKNFKSLNEYQKFVYLRVLIETNLEIDKLELEVYKINLENIEYGLYKQLLYYAKGLIMAKKYKMYKKSLKFCFLALNVDEHLFALKNTDKYIKSDVSYTVISLIEYNYFKLGKQKEAEIIAFNLIRTTENIYFNVNIPRQNIPKPVFRSYIAMLNNISDILFNNKEYNEAIIYCEKGIKVIKENNSFYGLTNFFDLLFQAYYCVNEFNKSRNYYEKAKGICFINDDMEYLNRIEARVEEKYQKLKQISCN